MTLQLWNMIINNMLLSWIPQRLDLYRMFFFFPVLSYANLAHFFKWPSNAMTWLENVYQRKSLLDSHLPHTPQSSPPDLHPFHWLLFMSVVSLSSCDISTGSSSVALTTILTCPSITMFFDDFSVPNLPCLVHGSLLGWTLTFFLFYSFSSISPLPPQYLN